MTTITKPRLSDMMELLLSYVVKEVRNDGKVWFGPDPSDEWRALGIDPTGQQLYWPPAKPGYSTMIPHDEYLIDLCDLVEGARSDNTELKYVYSILLERTASRAGYPGQVGKLISRLKGPSLFDRAGKVSDNRKNCYQFKFRTDYTNRGVVYRTWFSKTKDRNYKVLRHTVYANPETPEKATDVTYSASEYS